jgi:hypothetical protein
MVTEGRIKLALSHQNKTFPVKIGESYSNMHEYHQVISLSLGKEYQSATYYSNGRSPITVSEHEHIRSSCTMISELVNFATSAAIWKVVFSFLSGCIILRMIYQCWLHPLSQFPGPPLAAFSSFWQIYQDIFQWGSFSKSITELHRTQSKQLRDRDSKFNLLDSN